MRCYCGNNLNWSGDHMYNECGMDGEGIVSNMYCGNEGCSIDLVLVHTNFNTKQEKEKYLNINELKKEFSELEKRYVKLSEEYCKLKMISDATRN